MKKNIKQIVSIFLICTIVINSSSFVYASNYNGFKTVNVNLNNNFIKGDVPAIIMDGRTLVPLRLISENLGVDVNWDNFSKTVNMTSEARGSNTVDKELINLYSYLDRLKDSAYNVRYCSALERSLIPIYITLRTRLIKGGDATHIINAAQGMIDMIENEMIALEMDLLYFYNKNYIKNRDNIQKKYGMDISYILEIQNDIEILYNNLKIQLNDYQYLINLAKEGQYFIDIDSLQLRSGDIFRTSNELYTLASHYFLKIEGMI